MSYCYQNECEHDNFRQHNHCCERQFCCPCQCQCPHPKPEPKPEPKRLVAQLINTERQNLGTNDPFLFTTLQDVSTTDPNAPLYYNNTDGSITFNVPGRYIITYNTVVRFDDAPPSERVVVQLNQNGNIVIGSQTVVRDGINDLSPTATTISRTTVVHVQKGDKVQLICRRNPDQGFDFFRLTTLVIEQV